jgi:hypothetical protein
MSFTRRRKMNRTVIGRTCGGGDEEFGNKLQVFVDFALDSRETGLLKWFWLSTDQEIFSQQPGETDGDAFLLFG